MTRSRQIREMTGLSRVEFSRRYNIPLRTLENWDAGKSEPPAYVLDLLEKVIEPQEVRDYLIMWQTDSQWNTEMIQSFSAQKAVELARKSIPRGAEITEVAEIRRDWE